MKGITKERLLKLQQSAICHQQQELITEYDYLLKVECKELNPWLPISNPPPEHKRVLVKFSDGSMEVARWANDPADWLGNDNLDFDYGADIPTHWQELPEDPKE